MSLAIDEAFDSDRIQRDDSDDRVAGVHPFTGGNGDFGDRSFDATADVVLFQLGDPDGDRRLFFFRRCRAIIKSWPACSIASAA